MQVAELGADGNVWALTGPDGWGSVDGYATVTVSSPLTGTIDLAVAPFTGTVDDSSSLSATTVARKHAGRQSNGWFFTMRGQAR